MLDCCDPLPWFDAESLDALSTFACTMVVTPCTAVLIALFTNG